MTAEKEAEIYIKRLEKELQEARRQRDEVAVAKNIQLHGLQHFTLPNGEVIDLTDSKQVMRLAEKASDEMNKWQWGDELFPDVEVSGIWRDGDPLELTPERANALEERAERYRKALENIKKLGQVCEEFEICTHVACKASYTAWAISDEALAP